MLRFIATTAGMATVAATAEAPYRPPAPRNNNYGGNNRPNGYGYRPEPVSFPKPFTIIDPTYYSKVLSRYQTCLNTKCEVLPNAYSQSVKDSIATVGAYTSCVTACAAAEMLESAEDFRDLIGSVIEIGHDQLRQARQYLSGQGDFDVIANRVRIGDSCCLPQDYFASWERIMIPVRTQLAAYEPPAPEPEAYRPYADSEPYNRYDDSNDDYRRDYRGRNLAAEGNPTDNTDPIGAPVVADYMMSAASYLNRCADGKTTVPWLKTIECEQSVVDYLHFLQRNLGDLILTPECLSKAPDGACSEDSAPHNPRAVPFPNDVCVAYQAEIDGKIRQLTEPLLKPVAAQSTYYNDPCPPDALPKLLGQDDSTETIIHYYRVAQRDLKYWTVQTGLPSLQKKEGPFTICEYNDGLVNPAPAHGFFAWRPVPGYSKDEIDASRICPTNGLMEYCNVDQYASFLQTQLFDHTKCDVTELRQQDTDFASSYQTIACLYKIFTLKCDCMEAVLSCYAHANKFSTALSKTLGQAASILCGFILCQRPSVYSLFGEEYAIDHALIMKELLSAGGLMNMSSATPALVVFVSFGIGMIALVAAKKMKSSQTVKVEDGYSNLI